MRCAEPDAPDYNLARSCKISVEDACVVHKRLSSLTGLDRTEFKKKLQAEAEKENVEPKPLPEQS